MPTPHESLIEQPPPARPLEFLLARIDAHEAEAAAIETAMTALNLDAKKLKALKKARIEAKRAADTYAALVAGGMVPQ